MTTNVLLQKPTLLSTYPTALCPQILQCARKLGPFVLRWTEKIFALRVGAKTPTCTLLPTEESMDQPTMVLKEPKSPSDRPSVDRIRAQTQPNETSPQLIRTALSDPYTVI